MVPVRLVALTPELVQVSLDALGSLPHTAFNSVVLLQDLRPHPRQLVTYAIHLLDEVVQPVVRSGVFH